MNRLSICCSSQPKICCSPSTQYPSVNFSAAALNSLVAAGSSPFLLNWHKQSSSLSSETRRHSNFMPSLLPLPLLNEYTSVRGSEATESNHVPMRALYSVRFCKSSVAITFLHTQGGTAEKHCCGDTQHPLVTRLLDAPEYIH